MAAKVAALNPEVLKWARERAGLSLNQVATALDKTVEVVASWESGDSTPTYGQLETIAYRLFKRPLAIFFFPHPPIEEDPKTEFRLLPAFELESFEADMLLAARQARSMQESLRELTSGRNPVDLKIFRDVDARRFRSLAALCGRVREYLGVTLEKQCSWGSLRDALKNWRDVIEDHGIFVFKRSFKQREISGFSLADDEFPVIYLNNSTSDSRQIFSLFHELAHILYSLSGVTKQDLSYIEALPSVERRVEIACNRFAATFLVPDENFRTEIRRFSGSDEEVGALASRYNVSREVVLRKLLDLGRVDQVHYERKVRQWNKEYESREKGEGGNYYATQATYLGKAFLRLAFSSYYDGRCSLQDLAGHLGMRARNIERFEAFLTQGA